MKKLVLLLILSSLIYPLNYNAENVINPDGTSYLVLEVDYTPLFQQLQSQDPTLTKDSFSKQLETQCGNQCWVDHLTVIYEKKVENNEFYTYTEDYDLFVVRRSVLHVYNLPKLYPVIPGDYAICNDNHFARNLKLQESNFYYTIYLPDPISNAPGALKIDNNKAEFEVVSQLDDCKGVYVESYTFNLYRVVLGLTLAIALFLVFRSTFGMLFKKRPPKPNVGEEYMYSD
ncbi:hypothetical protein KO465_02340 [Candidatus Micrarchaeota archaeon]|jgi:hypothetical protein|nr:hypothetical protein [Candidatus Micrarchaeota archaeon]